MAASVARPWRDVPRWVQLFLLLLLLGQISWRLVWQPPITALPLSSAPWWLLGHTAEPALWSRLLPLRLQQQQHRLGQPALAKSNYPLLIDWLDLSLALDEHNAIPLVAASYYYLAVDEPSRAGQIIAFIKRHFQRHPQRYWWAMVQAIFQARYRLQDRALAVQLAQQLSHQPAAVAIPSWTRQIGFFLLRDGGTPQEAFALLSFLAAHRGVESVQQWRLLIGFLEELIWAPLQPTEQLHDAAE